MTDNGRRLRAAFSVLSQAMDNPEAHSSADSARREQTLSEFRMVADKNAAFRRLESKI
ncbi:hypothetical protein [Ensifer sp. B1-9]|uniref:hypothetical protein n=1 Tax=Ensifer sp. B1-9 TaxID=3141455 RepID=UPI003D1E86E0